MRRYAVYLPPGVTPGAGAAAPLDPGAFSGLVLVREGFSWSAFFLGPLYAFSRGMWTAGLGALALLAVAAGLPEILGLDAASRVVAILGYAVLCGISARDAWVGSLEDRGYRLFDVVIARDEAEALIRLAQRTGAEPRPSLGRAAETDPSPLDGVVPSMRPAP